MWNLSGVDCYWDTLQWPDMDKSPMLHMGSMLAAHRFLSFFLYSNPVIVFDVSQDSTQEFHSDC